MRRVLRFGIVFAVGAGADFAVIELMLRSTGDLTAAHLAGFLAGCAWLYPLMRARLFPHAEDVHFSRFLAVAWMALILRGGTIGSAVSLAGLPASLAILPGIVVTQAVILVGAVLFVFPASRAESAGAGAGWRTWAGGIFLFSLCMRLAYVGVVDLLPQEAYYWNYAQHPALSYLDHPPMVAWIIRFGTSLLGNSEIGVRIGAVILSLVAAACTIGLTRNLYGRHAATGAVLILGSFPFVVATGFFATPDAPLVASWAGTLYFLERAILGERRRAWIGAGVCLGLGLLSKYTIVLLVPATVLFLALDRKSRRTLLRPDPYLAIAIALLVFTPVLAWNARHDWMSFTFQGSRRMGSSAGFSLPQLVAFALILLTPPGLVLAFRSILQARANGARNASRKGLFLATVTLVPLSVFVFYSLFHRTMRVSWTIPIWLGAVPLMSRRLWIVWTGASQHTVARIWKVTIPASLIVIGTLLHSLSLGVPGFALRHSRELPVAWEELSREVDLLSARIERETGIQPLVVDAGTYYVASSVAYYGRDSRKGATFTSGGHLLGNDGLMYRFWFRPQDWAGRPMIIVGLKKSGLSSARFDRRFRKISPIREQPIHKDGTIRGRFYYRVGLNYRPPPQSTNAFTRAAPRVRRPGSTSLRRTQTRDT